MRDMQVQDRCRKSSLPHMKCQCQCHILSHSDTGTHEITQCYKAQPASCFTPPIWHTTLFPSATVVTFNLLFPCLLSTLCLSFVLMHFLCECINPVHSHTRTLLRNTLQHNHTGVTRKIGGQTFFNCFIQLFYVFIISYFLLKTRLFHHKWQT